MPLQHPRAGTARRQAGPGTTLRAILTSMAVLLLLTACTSSPEPSSPGEDDPPPRDEATYFVGTSGLGLRSDVAIGVFMVVDGAADPSSPVEDATVTINGTEIPYDAPSGHYRGSLPAAPAPGASVRLTVRIGDQLIEGTGSIPQVPTFTSPAPGANFAVGDPVEISWDLAEDPDSYELYLRAGGLSLEPHPISDGSARSLLLPSSIYDALPHDATPVSYQLTVYSDGGFSGPAHPDSSLRMRASSSAGNFSVGEAPPRTSYHFEGLTMGPRHQAVRVLLAEDGVPDRAAPVLDVTVRVNGQTLAYDAGSELFEAELPSTLTAGDRLNLSLDGPLGTVVAVGHLPDRPTITAPTHDAELAAHAPVVVEWESPTDPDAFVITVWGGPAPWRTDPIPGSERSHTFEAAEFDLGQYVLTLEAVSHGDQFSGAYSGSSTMGIHHAAVNDVRFRRVIRLPDLSLP